MAVAALFAVVVAFGAVNAHAGDESAEKAAAPEGGQKQVQIKPAETAHPRFMREFALWCYNVIAKEDAIRAAVIDYLKEKAAEEPSGKIAVDDLNQHTMELIMHIEEKAGLRMGAYKTKLANWAKLDDQEKKVYASGLRLLSGYIAAIEVEEGKKLGIFDKEISNDLPDPVKFKRRLLIGLAPYKAIELTEAQKKSSPSFIGAILALDKASKEALKEASQEDNGNQK